MATLERRIEKLEAVLLTVRLDHLSDAELRTYAHTLPFKSPRYIEVVLALIMRRRSTLPMYAVDPINDPSWSDDDPAP